MAEKQARRGKDNFVSHELFTNDNHLRTAGVAGWIFCMMDDFFHGQIFIRFFACALGFPAMCRDIYHSWRRTFNLSLVEQPQLLTVGV